MQSDEFSSFEQRHREKEEEKSGIRLIIEGRVQKVGYREWMKQTANSYSVPGWVRNKADGTVEAFIYSNHQTLREIVQACHKGPSFAMVKKIKEFPQKNVDNPPQDFTILPSS